MNQMRVILRLCGLSLLATLLATGKVARDAAISDFGGDRFASRASVQIQRPVDGELFPARL
jgi:hypothetical protein